MNYHFKTLFKNKNYSKKKLHLINLWNVILQLKETTVHLHKFRINIKKIKIKFQFSILVEIQIHNKFKIIDN